MICKTALRKLVFESQIVMLLRPGLDSLNTTGAMRFRPQVDEAKTRDEGRNEKAVARRPKKSAGHKTLRVDKIQHSSDDPRVSAERKGPTREHRLLPHDRRPQR